MGSLSPTGLSNWLDQLARYLNQSKFRMLKNRRQTLLHRTTVCLLAFLFISFLSVPLAFGQEGAGGENGESTAAATTSAETEGGLSSYLPMLLMPLALVMFMMMVMRPQQKDSAKRDEMLKQLKRNDRVVTAGGIVAKVQNVNLDQKTVKLMLDEKTGSVMTVTMEAISRVVTGDEKVESKDE